MGGSPRWTGLSIGLPARPPEIREIKAPPVPDGVVVDQLLTRRHAKVSICEPGGRCFSTVPASTWPPCASFTAARKSAWNCWGSTPMDGNVCRNAWWAGVVVGFPGGVGVAVAVGVAAAGFVGPGGGGRRGAVVLKTPW